MNNDEITTELTDIINDIFDNMLVVDESIQLRIIQLRNQIVNEQ